MNLKELKELGLEIVEQNEEKVLTLVGSWAKNRATATEIVMPDGVTKIGDCAFRDCKSLNSIKIHEGVTKIGNLAFADCISLTEISIPNSVTGIGGAAFCDCILLESIVIPESVTKIGDYAFEGCERLKEIYLHKNSRLNKKHLPAGVKIIRFDLDGKMVKIEQSKSSIRRVMGAVGELFKNNHTSHKKIR
jgi:hypothetical protein